MLEKGFDLRVPVEILNIEERIPKEHLLRKIDGAVGFDHIYDLVSSRYSADKGRRSIDPVVLFKIVLIQHLYGIPSLRLGEHLYHGCGLARSLPLGEKTPWIAKLLFDDGRIPCFPYKRPQTMKDGHKWYEYVYDEYYDQIICPEYKTLSNATTNREGYQEYKSKPYICMNCPTRHKCTHSKQCIKTVTRHVWQDYLERSEDVRLSPHGKAIYGLRKGIIERVFADTKEKHGMRYTYH